jgi:triacylglycerol esterase/lipase EstA (alpha/beta hydrolase family)
MANTMNEKNNDYPIIFVHGLFGWGPEEKGFGPYWGMANEVRRQFPDKVKFASVGPVASHWDRARELFYQIKGGDCDYGEEHADTCQHARLLPDWAKGKNPLYPDWDAKHPIHLIGHSQGACTIRMLQYLLAEREFEGYDTSADWIRSITTISGVNNGSTLAYATLGSKDGRLPKTPIMKFLELVIETIWYLTPEGALVKRLLENIPKYDRDYNWDLDQWGLRRWFFEPFTFFFFRILRHSFLYGKDNAAYDLSVHRMAEWNKALIEYPATYYLSYVTQQTKPSNPAEPLSHHIPDEKMNPLLKRYARKMGEYEEILLPAFDPAQWWPNDGAVSATSQIHPWLGRDEPALHKEFKEMNWPDDLAPQRWHVMPDTFAGWDHLDVVLFPESDEQKQKQYAFYENLCHNLWRLPSPAQRGRAAAKKKISN